MMSFSQTGLNQFNQYSKATVVQTEDIRSFALRAIIVILKIYREEEEEEEEIYQELGHRFPADLSYVLYNTIPFGYLHSPMP